MSEQILKTCPFCGAPGTNPLLHPQSCYISVLYAALQHGTSNIIEPPSDVLEKAWNTRFEPKETA